MNDLTHHARPLTAEEAKTSHAELLSFHGEIRRLGKYIVRASYVVGGFGLFCFAASAIGWGVILSRETTDVQWVKVGDNPTGEIAYGAKTGDAPILFGENERRHYMQQYYKSREGYIPDLDKRHWDIVLEMSAPTVIDEYLAWRKSDLSPVQQLGMTGQVHLSRFAFSLQGTGKNGTYEYRVVYHRQEDRSGTLGPDKTWAGLISFQWHPKDMKTPQQKTDNPGGMIVTAYSIPEPI